MRTINFIVIALSCMCLFAACKKKDSGGANLVCNTMAYRDQDTSAKVYFPTAFTPDWDGKNDVLRISSSSLIDESSFHLTVLSTFNEVMFETTDKLKGWDGTHSGAQAPEKLYYVHLVYKTLAGNTTDTMLCVHLFRVKSISEPCINTGGVTYYFEDQFDEVNSAHLYVTGQIVCP
jgi:gliding motility-associated-like protein